MSEKLRSVNKLIASINTKLKVDVMNLSRNIHYL